MDDVERLLREAQNSSTTPSLRPGLSRLVLRRTRRHRRLQIVSAGGAAVTVVVTGAVALDAGRPGRVDAQSGAGFAPAATDSAAATPAAGAGPGPRSSATAHTAAPSSSPAKPISTPATAARTTSPVAATTTTPPFDTAKCQAVKTQLAAAVGPAHYVLTSRITPAQFSWQRGWVHTGGVHAALELTAYCQAARATDFTADPAHGSTVTTVSVNGHPGWLHVDLGGSHAAVTWNANETTQITVAANGFLPYAWGKPSQSELKAARLTDAQLLAYADTVPTG